MRFNFTGELHLLKGDRKSFGSGTTSNGNPYQTFKASVSTAQNNSGFVEVFGTKTKTIKTRDNNNGKIEVDWEDRNDEKVVASVSSMRKYYSDLGERKEFITTWDLIDEFAEHEDELDKKYVSIRGDVQKDFYKGKIIPKFIVKNMYFADEEKAKSMLALTGEVFWDYDSLDVSEWKDSHIIYVNGYTYEYFSDVQDNRFVPQQLILDCGKSDFSDEKDIKRVQYKLNALGITYDVKTGGVRVALKKNKLYVADYMIKYQNGAEEIEWGVDCLTPEQLEQVELGFATVDSFKPKGDGSTFGNRVVKYYISIPSLNGKHNTGREEADFTYDEFQEKIFVHNEEVEQEKETEKASEVGQGFMPAPEDDLFA